jgi:hypothetical protein
MNGQRPYNASQRPPQGQRGPHRNLTSQDGRPAQPTPRVRLDAQVGAANFTEAITNWARNQAEQLVGSRDATTTSTRRFFNEFASIAAACPNGAADDLPPHVQTRLQLLIPRALYALERKNAAIPRELAELVVMLVNYASNVPRLAEARSIFEAVLGYAVGMNLKNR